jgi:hypothetical protein
VTAASKVSDKLIADIKPSGLYRVRLAPKIFGLGIEATREKIKSGELPTPIPLSASSRARAWTGVQILEHRAAMAALAEAKKASPAPAPQPAALHGRIKKRKLTPPSQRKDG